MKQVYSKWICMALCALLLCAAALMIPAREAKAAASVAVVGGSTSYSFTDAPGAYTVTSVTGLDTATETITNYAWTTDGTVLSNPDTASGATLTSITPKKGSGWVKGATGGSVTCTVTITPNAEGSTPYTVSGSVTGIGVSEGTRTLTLTPDKTSVNRVGSNKSVTVTVGISPNTEYDAAKLSATVSPDDMTVSKNGNAFTLTASATTQMGDHTITVTHDATDNVAAASDNTTVNVARAERTLTIGNVTMNAGASTDVTVTPNSTEEYSPSNLIISTVTGGTSGTVTATNNNNGTIKLAASTGAHGTFSFTVDYPETANYSAPAQKTVAVTVNLIAPTVTWPTNFSVGKGATGTFDLSNSHGATTFTSDNSAVFTVDNDGSYEAKAIGNAVITFSQAAVDNFAAVTPNTFNVTVAASTFGFNPSSVTITADKGTATVTAAVGNAGSAALAPVTLSGWNNDVILVKSTSSPNGSNTFTITARSQGTTSITATTTVGGVTQTATLNVTVSYANKSYFTISSWYHYLDNKQRYTEVTATLHNPGNGVPTNARTYWYMDNSVTKTLWINEYLQYDSGSNTYFTRARLKAMRNGTNTIHMSVNGTSGAVGVEDHVHVSRMSYIPQSGQDSTAIYVVSALLMASAAATAGVYLYRRKRSRS